MKFPDRRDRKTQDDDIGEDRRSGVGDPGTDLVDAVTWKIGIPQFGDRDADEDEKECDGDDPSKDERTHNPGHLLKVGHAEDAVVHEQKTQLGPSQIPSVENFCDDEPFRHHDDLGHGDFISMKTHTVCVHGKDEAHDNQIPSLKD